MALEPNEFMADNPHAEGNPDEMVEVRRGDWNDFHGFRRHFGEGFDHTKFDRKRYDSVKDIDPTDYQSQRQFIEAVEGDDAIYDVVHEMLRAKRENRKPDLARFTEAEKQAGKDAVDNGAGGQAGARGAAGTGKQGAGTQRQAGETNQQYEDRLKNIEKRFEESDRQQLNDKFYSAFDKAVEGLKSKGVKLSERETGYLETLVVREYRMNGRLGMDHVAETVNRMFEGEVEALRKEITGDRNRTRIDRADDSPAGNHGGGASIPGKKYDPTTASSEQRVGRMREELREAMASE